jgi:hypothetical protein
MTERPKFEPYRVGPSDCLERVAAALGDPLLAEVDRKLLRIIAVHRGAANAVRAEAILGELGLYCDGNARRWVKATVEDLVTRLKVPIGGLRMKPYGYFLVVTQADMDLALQPLQNELLSLARRIRALTDERYLSKLNGQLMLRLDLFPAGDEPFADGAQDKRGAA